MYYTACVTNKVWETRTIYQFWCELRNRLATVRSSDGRDLILNEILRVTLVVLVASSLLWILDLFLCVIGLGGDGWRFGHDLWNSKQTIRDSLNKSTAKRSIPSRYTQSKYKYRKKIHTHCAMAFTTICYTCHIRTEMKIIFNVRVFFMKSTSIQRLVTK
jgi:hypothetical protein